MEINGLRPFEPSSRIKHNSLIAFFPCSIIHDPHPQQQLESYLWGAAVLLRGTIDAGDYKQFIFRCCSTNGSVTTTRISEWPPS
jgi:hypothetical protein